MKSYGHLNPAYPTEYPGGNGNKSSSKRRKACLIGIPIAIVVVVVVVVVSVVATKDNGDKAIPLGSKAVNSICKGSLYPEQCTSTLDGAPNSNTANPKEFAIYLIQKIKTELSASLFSANNLLSIPPVTRQDQALTVCLQVLADAKDYLDSAGGGLTSLSVTEVDQELEDIHAWLDASATNHETCLDELIQALNIDYQYNTTTYVPPTDDVSVAGENIRQLYSILLQVTNFVTSYASKLPQLPVNLPDLPAFPKINFRRLLSEEEEEVEGEQETRSPFVVDEQSLSGWVSRHGISRRLLQLQTAAPNAVVDSTGGGDYKTIQAAVNGAPEKSSSLWIIYIKKGIYQEQVEVPKKKINIAFRGDGEDITILSGSLNVIDGSTTFASATLIVSGTGFLGTGFTVRNTAGPAKHQAVALRVSADLVAFYKVTLRGFQDTLYTHSLRQFYSQCTVVGTVDFIFGNAAVIIQDSTLLASTGLVGQQNTFTAQGRTDPGMNTGIILHGSRLSPDAAYQKQLTVYKSYMGRPWKAYCRTVLVDCFLDTIIQPEGWLPWDGDLNLKTLYYAEFKSKGPGSGTAKRVSWSTQITDKSLVGQYLANKFVSAKKWLTATSIPYYATTFKP